MISLSFCVFVSKRKTSRNETNTLSERWIAEPGLFTPPPIHNTKVTRSTVLKRINILSTQVCSSKVQRCRRGCRHCRDHVTVVEQLYWVIYRVRREKRRQMLKSKNLKKWKRWDISSRYHMSVELMLLWKNNFCANLYNFLLKFIWLFDLYFYW